MLDAGQHITGLVGALSSGAGNTPDSEYWTLVFYLCAWRAQNGDICQQKQRCELPNLTKEQAQQLMQQVTPWQQLSLYITGQTPRGAVLLEKLAPAEHTDTALLDIAEQLQQPVTLATDLFGELTLDRSLDLYEGTVTWCDKEISLTLDDGDMPESALATATALCSQQQHWQQQAINCAIADLLPLKNDNWLEENQQPLSAEEFASKLTLKSIVCYDDNGFTFYFSDGELFFGHCIMVNGDLSEGITDASIAG